MMDKVPMTAAGFQRLQEELKHLKGSERPAVIRAIAEARDHGDLSENAEYHAARERQSFIEGQIGEIEDRDEATYQLVGEFEADINAGLLSITSPLARALIGKQVSDNIEVTTPGGSKAYEILKVEFR